MSLKDNVVERACTWRQKQKDRIAAPAGALRDDARNAEYHASKKLAQAVDLWEQSMLSKKRDHT